MTAALATVASGEPWDAANQRRLMDGLRPLRLLLERRAGRAAKVSAPVDAPSMVTPANPAPGARPMALDRLCAVFRLSAFEREVLLLCAGVELDASFAELVAAAQGDPQRAIPPSAWRSRAPGRALERVEPASPLRRWRLLEITPGPAHRRPASDRRARPALPHRCRGDRRAARGSGRARRPAARSRRRTARRPSYRRGVAPTGSGTRRRSSSSAGTAARRSTPSPSRPAARSAWSSRRWPRTRFRCRRPRARLSPGCGNGKRH